MNNFLKKYSRPWLAAVMLGITPLMAQEADHPLSLDAQAISDAGIVVDRATARDLTEELKAPGEVKADAYSTELVSPRIDSMVLARKVRLGDVVKAGQPLVMLSSVQVAETQGALIVAEQDWQRVASLGAQAVSGRRYTEVKVQRDQARAKLRAYGLSDAQIAGVLRAGRARSNLVYPGEGGLGLGRSAVVAGRCRARQCGWECADSCARHEFARQGDTASASDR
jgi:cobalt-zinc-cadmium efflux system membrane fusion protein